MKKDLMLKIKRQDYEKLKYLKTIVKSNLNTHIIQLFLKKIYISAFIYI